MKFKKWFLRVSLFKYPAIIAFALWGSSTALQPGVSGFKSQGDLLGSYIVRRIDLKKINLSSQTSPRWCILSSISGPEGTYRSARCGFGGEKQQAVREMYWDGVWNGSETIYKEGNIFDYLPGSEDVVDFKRDWEWLEFFYGYGPPSIFGTALLGLAYVHVNAVFFAGIAFILFLAFDAFALAFLSLRFALKKLKR